MCKKDSIVICAVVVTVASLAMFLPGKGVAGALEPPAAPAPTMKTLDQIPPTWSMILPASERFVVLADFNNEAVFDKETGLVWEKSPDTGLYIWGYGVFSCARFREFNGRIGWHLPTVEQLASLVDRSVAGSPKLPAGHPFENVLPSDIFWAAATYFDSDSAWAVDFGSGLVTAVTKSSTQRIWCVRGGQSPHVTGASGATP